MESKEFPADVVVTAMTGIFICEKIDELHEILNYLTGGNLFTHQLSRALSECALWLKQRHGDLLNTEDVQKVFLIHCLGDRTTIQLAAQETQELLRSKYGMIAVTPIVYELNLNDHYYESQRG